MSALDLETAEEDEFSPDKLRANVERLYMTVIVGVITFGKHIARLRSWREPRRTAAFTVVCIDPLQAHSKVDFRRHTSLPGSLI